MMIKDKIIRTHNQLEGSMGEAMYHHPSPHTTGFKWEESLMIPVCRSSSPLRYFGLLNIMLCMSYAPTH